MYLPTIYLIPTNCGFACSWQWTGFGHFLYNLMLADQLMSVSITRGKAECLYNNLPLFFGNYYDDWIVDARDIVPPMMHCDVKFFGIFHWTVHPRQLHLVVAAEQSDSCTTCILNWQSFWERFQASIYNKPHFGDFDKLAYLWNTLKCRCAMYVLEGLMQMEKSWSFFKDCYSR